MLINSHEPESKEWPRFAVIAVVIGVAALLGIGIYTQMPTDVSKGKVEAAPLPPPIQPSKVETIPPPAPPPPTKLPEGAFSFMGFFLGQNLSDVRRVADGRSYDVTCKPIHNGVQKCSGSRHPGVESQVSEVTALLFSFMDGKLYLIQYGFPTDKYSEIETALLLKYGDPTTVIMKEVHHGVDTLPSKNSAWVRGFDLLLLTERNLDGGTFSVVKLTDTPSFQEATSRGEGEGADI